MLNGVLQEQAQADAGLADDPEPAELDAVSRALANYGFVVQSAELGYRPKNPLMLSAAEREEVEAFLEAIDADDDVQNVYVGLAG